MANLSAYLYCGTGVASISWKWVGSNGNTILQGTTTSSSAPGEQIVQNIFNQGYIGFTSISLKSGYDASTLTWVYNTTGASGSYQYGTNWAACRMTAESYTRFGHWQASPKTPPASYRADIVYHANGGSGSNYTQSVSGSNRDSIPATIYSLASTGITAPSGKTFQGWSTSSGDNNSVTHPVGTSVTLSSGGTLNLYAVWRSNILIKPVLTLSDITNTSVRLNYSQTQDYPYVQSIVRTGTVNGSGTAIFTSSWKNTGGSGGWWDVNGLSVGTTYTARMRYSSSSADTTGTWVAAQELPSYTITFHKNDGTGVTKHQYTSRTNEAGKPHSYTIPDITIYSWTNPGYYFSCWSNSATTSSTNYPAGGTKTTSQDLDLYVHWQPNSYTILFNANGGSGRMESMSMYYGSSQNLRANAFTRTQVITYDYGYSGKDNSTVNVARPFVNWRLNNAATGATYENGALVSNLTTTNGGNVTMYAQWGNYTVSLPNPIRSGYTFKGWYDASGNYVGAGNSTLTGTTDRTLYAHWDVDVVAPTISYSSHTDTSITISLNRNGATSGSWVVEVSGSNSFGSIISAQTITSTTQTSIRIDGLSPNTTYYIRVRHVNGNNSAASNTLMASTRISQFQWTSNDEVNIVAGQDFSTMILASKWNELIDKVDWCLRKSGKGTSGMSDVSAGSDMTATRFNAMRNAIASMNSSVVASKSIGDEIKAAYFANASSSLRSTINAIIVTL